MPPDTVRAQATRTCVACRQEAARDDLVRLVADPDGVVVLDLRSRLPGRGAWVHAELECLQKLEREPRIAGRALGLPLGKEPPRGLSELARQLREGILRTVLDGLSLAQAAGDLVSGHDALEAAILQGKIAEIVVAADAAERTVRDLVRDQEGIELTHLPIDRVALGAQIGADPRAAVGLVRSPAFRHLRSQLRRLRSLG
jgi:predicted RNA-binding protein YlxR (DUF448 family)/ribosomal protein L7Ae-like RNA K-turn-binding protein